MAPQGSSTLITRSLKRTPKQTRMPARMPMTTAEFELTNAQGAVMATRPASMPLQAIEISGLPKTKYQKIIAVAEAATAADLLRLAWNEGKSPSNRTGE